MEDQKSEKHKIQKIKNIVEKEIEKELISKQNEVSDISEKIKVVLKNLELLKYVVAVSYYDQNPTLTPKKGQDEENEDEKLQTQIHPCIKKLLPFQSSYSKAVGDVLGSHSYETRRSKKAVPNESVPLQIKKEVEDDFLQKKNNLTNNIKIPQYIPPLPTTDDSVTKVNSQVNARGNVSKENYRIIVGNVSKWIPPDTREDNSTHKWMVYIRNKDGHKDILKELKKVRYFLHESYKPHDVIDVTAPFHLTRRGWGEFPIRVQFHFTHPLNKPVDIIHNLKLDMTCSGVQMLGSETEVEISLYQGVSISNLKDTQKSEINLNNCFLNEETVKEKSDVFDGNLLTSINGINSCKGGVTVKEEIDSEIVIKKELEDPSESELIFFNKFEEMKIAISNSRKFLLDRRKAMQIIEIEHNYLGSGNNQLDKAFSIFTDSLLKVESKKAQNGEKNCQNRTVFDPLQINQAINRSQDHLNKIDMAPNNSEEEVFKSLKTFVSKLETESQSKHSMKAFRHMYLVNVLQRAHGTKLKTVESLIKWFVQRWPIITKLSLDPIYKTVHPYSCPTEEEFFKYNIGKQRSAEWFRAKAIQKVLKSLKSVIPIKEEIWSTKQILLWSRFHGYTPSLYQVKEQSDFIESNELKNKRLKINESSSDSEDDFDNISKFSSSRDNKFLNGLSMSERKKNFKKSRRKDFGEETPGGPVDFREYNTCTELNDALRFGYNDFRVLQPTTESDVEIVELENEAEKGSPTKKGENQIKIVTTPSSQTLFNKFVSDTARQIGIKITNEEVIPGVTCDSVSRVMSQSVCSFMDELIRRSFAHGWMRNGEKCPESVEVNDVLATLINFPHFDIFTNRGLGTSQKPET